MPRNRTPRPSRPWPSSARAKRTRTNPSRPWPSSARAKRTRTRRPTRASPAASLLARLDQPQSDRVGDGVGPVAQLEPAGHVVDDRLDRPVRQEQALADLGRVEALGQELEDLDLALGQPADREASRLEDLP